MLNVTYYVVCFHNHHLKEFQYFTSHISTIVWKSIYIFKLGIHDPRASFRGQGYLPFLINFCLPWQTLSSHKLSFSVTWDCTRSNLRESKMHRFPCCMSQTPWKLCAYTRGSLDHPPYSHKTLFYPPFSQFLDEGLLITPGV